ncbi:bifunctional P-450:NADPH-P450 reductase [Coniosporium apollinis CBS 100218]|uniref:Bifunctional cytochrome P450/NADPH--P450 reductase n=1 Tax=Coniosporium apollinis (strain CBS 100218) TaxID=1168221 RepID=R7YHN8_CONA1|nr:bifunctional P-450:NADPH-P450 reductase [Coniosporium apollinis CBS 100218]EON61408.1 bifunctional P-450:NADPH-P450 reductase [Coniosporium apollinis CBS 100218]
MPDTVPIPCPPGLPFLGNVADIDPEFPLGSLNHLSDIYGPIYRMTITGKSRVVIGSQALMNEVSDESRFSKIVAAALEEVRNGTHDGLFTAYGPEEKNWGIAHRILIPAFGPLSIRGMFDEMHDIAGQLVMKWARHGSSYSIPVTDDFTRLTLDTIALCAMDYRFNSYYREQMHPFIQAMGDFLTESGNRSRRPALAQVFYRQANYKYEADIELLRETADELVQTRKQHPTERKDLLNAMLKGTDPKTGEHLSDENIIDNLITFLIAGHETTSGLLSFVFYYLLKNPLAYQKAQEEVDRVIGNGPITVDHMSKIPYITAILRETLRLCPTAPAFAIQAHKPEIIGGKYQVEKGEPVIALLTKVHRDPVAYGEDADEWKPERMLDEEFDRRNKEYPNCWKPFGNGSRACIGRPFAWQEALLVVAMLLQNFNFVAEDPSYQLQFKQTLTIKPKGFRMRAMLRNNITPTTLERGLSSRTISTNKSAAFGETSKVTNKPITQAAGGKKMVVLYGSNTGTCEALAQRLASDAPAHGFQATRVDSLDSSNQALPTDQPVVIITASYEGQPPDNAAHFVTWLQSLKGSEAENVAFSVFACGHHDWANTFHKIPQLVDDLLEQRGGKRIAPMGKADAAAGDMFTDFENWEDQVFWPAMVKQYGASEVGEAAFESGLKVEISSPRSSTLRQDVKEARVINEKLLTADDAPQKKHIEISLPSDMTYSTGDYLAILPINPKDNVQRAMRYFGLAWDSVLTLSSAGPTALPTGVPISTADLFGAYVELAQPATKRNVLALAEATKDEATKIELTRLSDSAFTEEISNKRVSILDLLERFPSVSLPLGPFLQLLPPMRVRQYSISSSPLWNPHRVTLTYAVLDQPSLSGHGRYVGVASNYLSGLTAGDRLHVSVRQSHQAFHLPSDPEKVPIICIAAGTGLAPFRGFIQERAAQIAAGRDLAPALLFFGCRDPEVDDLYAAEFAKWEKMGAVEVRRAYSRKPEASDGCRYVQDRLWAERKDAIEMWEKGAKCFVCGSREVGEAVKETSIKIMMERAAELGKEKNEEEAKEWFEKIRNDRYATDVFA